MKRDMDLIRAILLAAEASPTGFAHKACEQIEGYTREQIGYHVYLLIDAGLAQGADITHRGSSGPEAILTCLTSAGHDFLDSARSQSVWQQVKTLLMEKAGPASFAVWQAALTAQVLKNLGLK